MPVSSTAQRPQPPAHDLLGIERLPWWQRTIVYEVYPKSFLDTRGQGAGTIAGVTAKLDYLRSLGVGAVWLTPVLRSPMVDNGYDVADYYAIDPAFGTMEDMDALFAAARERGMRIVMDLVLNHTSNEHAWFRESSSSRTNPRADWYVWRDPAPDGGAPTNWRSIFGGSAWTWCAERGQYYLHTFAPEQPDLNWANPQVRQAACDVADFWARKGAGGFRIDAITYIKKPAVFADATSDAPDGLADIHAATANTPGILDYLREFRERVCTGRDVFLVGEANGVTAAELPDWVGPRGVFHMLIEFNHMDVPTGGACGAWHRAGAWRLTQLKSALAASQRAVAACDGWYPVYLENHDQPRSVANFLPPHADPVAGARMLAAVLLTMRGTPFIYQGEELGYTNVAWDDPAAFTDVQSRAQYRLALDAGKSPEEALACVRRFGRENARTPMQWSAQVNAGFSDQAPWLPVHGDYAACNVESQSADPHSVLTWYRFLAELRASCPELVTGDWCELLAHDERILAYTRSDGAHTATVLANFSTDAAGYDPKVVAGAALLVSTHGEAGATLGTLRPLEAQVWRRPVRRMEAAVEGSLIVDRARVAAGLPMPPQLAPQVCDAELYLSELEERFGSRWNVGTFE